MTAREKFQAALNNGSTVNSLAFTGWLSDWTKNDSAWLRRQVAANRIAKVCGGYPFYRPAYQAV